MSKPKQTFAEWMIELSNSNPNPLTGVRLINEKGYHVSKHIPYWNGLSVKQTLEKYKTQEFKKNPI